ncbi:conserved hypothetical protein [uncultured Defluviicoccus sp.]|uniref:Class I SAM-dependent methyltransferase n=1 Tax=metagenome TaxID=256318 RepID=A0A380TKG0_9ZZZZ|nr:conserved hypothetical protein [uncultured Defluviicoccus sp.]
MKTQIKYFLSRQGLFTKLDLARRVPEIVRWLRSGSRGAAPLPVKRMVVNSYLRAHALKYFVETGTHLGDTLAAIAQDPLLTAISVELDDAYFDAARERFGSYPNVTLLKGDSGALMPQIVSQLQQPALFWLDGHYSGGITAKDELATPVSAELQAILSSEVHGHVILIDDARCFEGTDDYPRLEDLLALIRADGRYDIQVSTDIIRLTPRIPEE